MGDGIGTFFPCETVIIYCTSVVYYKFLSRRVVVLPDFYFTFTLIGIILCADILYLGRCVECIVVISWNLKHEGHSLSTVVRY